MATPAASLGARASSPLPAQVGIGVGVVRHRRRSSYWFIFYSERRAARSQARNAQATSLQAELAAQQQAQASYFADRDELALRAAARSAS